MTGASLGRKAKFYLNNSGNFASPAWAAIPQFSDLTRSGEWDTTEVNTRESSGKMAIKTLVDLAVSGKLKFVAGDNNIATIMDAFFSPDGFLDIMVLNGDMATPGTYGVRFQCQVTSDNEDRGLTAAVMEDLKFTPTPLGGNAPQSAKVIGSSPVFTNL
jgi:hypothetical protein